MGSSVDPTVFDPEPDRVDFIEHTATGRVHVAMTPAERDRWWTRAWETRPIYRELYPPGNPAVFLMFEPVPCLCGLLAHRPSTGGSDAYVSAFPDEALCGTCRRVFARSRDVALLFEHPQADPSPDDIVDGVVYTDPGGGR